MKIKTDFITNSSSSSFVMIGMYLDPAEIPDQQLLALFKKHVSAEKEYTIDYIKNELDKYLPDYISEFIEDVELEYEFGDERWDGSSNVAIGMKYSQMQENETLGEFKNKIKNQIDETFGIDSAPGHILECWEDR